MAQWAGLLLLILFSSKAYAGWDIEYWHYFRWNNWEKEKFKVYTTAEFRLEKDLSEYYYNRVTGNLSYRPISCADLELHYSLMNMKSHGTPSSTPFRFIQRYELELNPFMEWENGFKIHWRNRMEFIKRENLNYFQYVFRHRTELIFPLKIQSGAIMYKIFDEIFYDFDIKKFTQNRFTPILLSFELNKNVHFGIFFSIRNFFSLGSKKWFRSFVFGSELQF